MNMMSTSQRATTTHLAALFLLVILVFILSSSLVQLNRGVRRNNWLRIDDPIVYPRLSGLASEHRNITDYHRFLRRKDHLTVIDRVHNFAFVLQSGLWPATHPSQPYYVMINEAGEHLQTIEDGHPDYPLSRLADFRDPRDAGREVIFFFVVPKTSGGIMKAIMSKCYNLRRTERRENPESMTFIDGVLNIDTQTLQGLAKARANKIIDSDLVDVIATSYFLEGVLLFRSDHRGRAFTIIQHPVLRAERLYNSQYSTQEQLSGLPGFLDSEHYHDNWLVRSLTNDKKGVITEDHFTVAKGILARKFFIGIDEYLEETIKRLEVYYGWGERGDRECVNKHLENLFGRAVEMPHTIERGDENWNLIATKDRFDLMLYYYALELFVKQGSTMFSRPYVDKNGDRISFTELRKKRLVDETMARMGLPLSENNI